MVRVARILGAALTKGGIMLSKYSTGALSVVSYLAQDLEVVWDAFTNLVIAAQAVNWGCAAPEESGPEAA